MPATTRERPKFRIGDRVTFTFGPQRVNGFVVEDRGRLGVGGQRIYGVRLDVDPDDSMFLERSEDDIDLAREPEKPLSKDEIRDYLVRGGLLLMLHSGPNGRSPQVWLRRDNLGNVTHTFVKERGLVGGAVPPILAYADDKVFAGKRTEVAEFITSFGLSDREANEVIDRVGTRP